VLLFGFVITEPSGMEERNQVLEVDAGFCAADEVAERFGMSRHAMIAICTPLPSCDPLRQFVSRPAAAVVSASSRSVVRGAPSTG
jgi:hypothetical protein